MKVYVVRHGESETNEGGKWTGWFDAKLTQKGIEDAKKAAAILKDVKFDKIYASDLKRAQQTAENAIPNCEYEVLPLIKEIDVGRLENTLISDLTDEQRINGLENGYSEFGGESREQFYKRIEKTMKMLEQQNFENVALFSHGGWLHGILNLALETKIARHKVCCNNCTVAVFEYTNKNWRLYSWINF